ncbi:peptidylprolyl isomerase [Dokdonella sp.]|uniref:FKBP-type peptidyl-prolyl cis-trans isomerase n=1 Tax=Dokdonella sp. TaxID=2291710 RepID=UPI003528D073
MQVAKDTVVSLHYTLHADDGLKIESSRDGGEPVHILVGHGGIIPGLEKALIGHDVGEQFSVDVEPREAYGERQPGNVQRVPKKYFKAASRLRPGMTAMLSMKDGGNRSVTVLKVGSSVIDVDLNHPLAGRKLRFDVDIVDVREATSEEISHRHVHGPGGVEHS